MSPGEWMNVGRWAGPRLPTSDVGLWLYAHALYDLRLARSIRAFGPEPGVDAVLRHAFEDMLRRVFPAPPDPASLAKFIDHVKTKHEFPDHVDIDKATDLVRSVFDGTLDDVGDVDATTRWFIQGFVFVEGAAKLGLSRRKIASLLIQLERAVQREGYLLNRATIEE